MTREEANIKMKDKANRELWIMEVLGTPEEPKSTKYYKGWLYVVWHEDHYRWGEDEAEIYSTGNLSGECETDVTLEEYKKLKRFTPTKTHSIYDFSSREQNEIVEIYNSFVKEEYKQPEYEEYYWYGHFDFANSEREKSRKKLIVPFFDWFNDKANFEEDYIEIPKVECKSGHAEIIDF